MNANTQQALANSSFTIRRPLLYNISVDDLADWYASAYHRTYATQNPDMIEEFHAQLADMAHFGYILGGSADTAYLTYYHPFMQENGRDISQQPEEIKRLSAALACMTLCGAEYHRHTNIFLYRMYVGLLEAILTDPFPTTYMPEQDDLWLFIQELENRGAEV